VAPEGVVQVTWSGENMFADQVRVYAKDAAFNTYQSAVYVEQSQGSLLMKMPAKPGDYEFRYVRGQSHLVRSPVVSVNASCPPDGQPQTSAEHSVSVTATCAKPGAGVEVSWSGPNKFADQIRLARRLAGWETYASATYVQADKEVAILDGPKDPGEYQARYIRGQTLLAVSDNFSVADNC
jgi:hypothetical protein